MKATHAPNSLPMRGRRNAAKLIKLAESFKKPQYFQHGINSLTKDTTHGSQEESQAEELTVVDSPIPVSKEGQQKGKQKRKAITGGGLLD